MGPDAGAKVTKQKWPCGVCSWPSQLSPQRSPQAPHPTYPRNHQGSPGVSMKSAQIITTSALGGQSDIFRFFGPDFRVLGPGTIPTGCAPRFPADPTSPFLEISIPDPKNDQICWSDNMSKNMWSILGPLLRLSPKGPLTKNSAPTMSHWIPRSWIPILG